MLSISAWWAGELAKVHADLTAAKVRITELEHELWLKTHPAAALGSSSLQSATLESQSTLR